MIEEADLAAVAQVLLPVSRELGIPFFLVGRVARDLLLKDHFDCRTENENFDFNHAWFRILGRDVGQSIKRKKTGACLLAILEREKSKEPFYLVTLLKQFLNKNFEESMAVFKNFDRGVRDVLLKDAS